MRKLLIVSILSAAAILPGRAQKFTVDGSVELYSAYIWRGDKVCGAQISPYINFHYGAWTLQSFGFLAIDNSYKEIDWDLSYKIKDFSLHFADYFYRRSTVVHLRIRQLAALHGRKRLLILSGAGSVS